jgi:uncharacterized protein YggE
VIAHPTHVLALLLIAVAATGLRTPAQAQDLPKPVVTVTGEASISVAPDLAQVRVGVTSQAPTAREASEANNAVMTRVIAAIKDFGIADKDFQTSRLSLLPIREPPRGSELTRISAFQASNQVTVKVQPIEKVSELIDRLVAAGANEITGIELRVSSPSQVLDAARADAMANARHKAEIYARAAGIRLGRAISITEGEGAGGPVFTRQAADLPIAPGERTLRVSVTVAFELLH